MSYQENFEAMTFDYDLRQLERPLHQCARTYSTTSLVLSGTTLVVVVQDDQQRAMDVVVFRTVSHTEATLAARKLQGMIDAAKALVKGSA